MIDMRLCSMGVGCAEASLCYAEAHDEPERCPLKADAIPVEYAAELRAKWPDITDAGIASFWRARHLPTD